MFRRLAVFAGGWTLNAAERVMRDDALEYNASGRMKDEAMNTSRFIPHPSSLILDFLSRLVDKSLVIVETQDGASRYRMLETIREYAQERLVEVGEFEHSKGTHLDWMVHWATQAEPKLRGPEQIIWLDRLEIELNNLRTALGWALEARAVEKGLTLIATLGRFWNYRDYWQETQELVSQLLRRAQELGLPKTTTRAKALIETAYAALMRGDWDTAYSFAQESVAIARALKDQDPSLLAFALARFARVLVQKDVAAARAASDESLALARVLEQTQNRQVTAFSLMTRSLVLMNQAELGRAQACLEEGLKIYRELGDIYLIAATEWNLTYLLRAQGDLETARVYAERLMREMKQIGDQRILASTQSQLGQILAAQGDYERSEQLQTEALRIRKEIGARMELSESLSGLARLAVSRGEYVRAAHLYREELLLELKTQHHNFIGHTLAGFAALACAQAQPLRAARLLGASRSFDEAIGVRPDPEDQREFDANLESARAQLRETEFARAWAEGQAMALEQAAEYALAEEN